MAKRDYYDVLGVKPDVGADQIKAAYRRLARKYHPDVNKAADATAKFREATAAYEVLSDPRKRQMYDRFGHEGPAGGPGGAGRAGPGGWTYRWTGQPGAGVGFEELFGAGKGGFMGMSLEELLAALGGGRRGAKGGARPGGFRAEAPEMAGQDLESEVTLDFLQAVRGTTLSLRLGAPGQGGQETLNVRIPPGVKEGSRVRVCGKGASGPGGRGDLYIITHIRPHPYFTRQDDDIYVEVPISIAEAALGTKVDVPTIDGLTTVTIPPGTGGSRRLRLRGKGLSSPNGKSRGDQYVVVRIVPPPQLSSRGRELLEEFQRTERFDPREDAPWR